VLDESPGIQASPPDRDGERSGGRRPDARISTVCHRFPMR
jgi:hypothetical protein